jgi:hypothetical protein
MEPESDQYERIRTWNREHPDQHYGALPERKKRDVRRGKHTPLILTLLGWFAMSVWRIICLVIAVVVIILVLYLLSKTGPGCHGSADQCIY